MAQQPMDMNNTFYLRKEDRDPQWRLVDADGKILGRLATEITDALRGKDKAHFSKHTDVGDYIVVINAEKVKLTGNKEADKQYVRYTGWIGGQKVTTAAEMRAKKPEKMIELAVKGMMPKNRIAREMIKKLKVYAGSEHPHKAQLSKTA